MKLILSLHHAGLYLLGDFQLNFQKSFSKFFFCLFKITSIFNYPSRLWQCGLPFHICSSSSQKLFSYNMLTSAICTHFRTVFAVFINLCQRLLSEPVNSGILYFIWSLVWSKTVLPQFPSSFRILDPPSWTYIFWIQSPFRDSTFIGCLSLVPFWREFPHHLWGILVLARFF